MLIKILHGRRKRLKFALDMNRRLLYMLLFAIVAMPWMTSCHSSRGYADDIYEMGDTKGKHKGKKGKKHSQKKPSRHDRTQESASKRAQRVIDEAYAWMGVPYRYGGNDRGGVDCSGLTCHAFEHGAGIKLPRSSMEQADRCLIIARSKLRPGDLVFFSSRKGGGAINHVAIYLGDNRVIHSTSSKGVTVSSLDEPYWATHLYTCGRVEEL